MPRLQYDCSLLATPDAADFHHSAFVQRSNSNGKTSILPSPLEVRAQCNENSFGTVTSPDLELFVKYSLPHKASIDEARTLQSLQQALPSSVLPVSELCGWRTEDGINYIYISLIHGSTLDSVWDTLSSAEKDGIATQAQEFLLSLRSLEHPHAADRYIGSISGGCVQDTRFRGDENFGPFKSTKSFNDRMQSWSLNWLPLSQRPAGPLRALLPDTSEIYFTHADLHLKNVMISNRNGPRRIVGIVDWGQAGCYPGDWEFCKALLLNGHHEWYTNGWLLKAMQPYDDTYDAFVGYWQCRPA